MFKEFFDFVGITKTNNFFKDILFYIALLLGPVFWFFLSFFVKAHLYINNPLCFFITQFFLIAFPEEFFFRGFLLSVFKKYISLHWHEISLANVIVAIIFSLFHLIGHSYLWAFGVFFPALIFGYFREKHNSLWPAVILHFFYNSGYFALF